MNADISQGIKLFPLTILAKRGERGFGKRESPPLPKGDFAGISIGIYGCENRWGKEWRRDRLGMKKNT